MRTLVTADLHFTDKSRDNYRHEFIKQLTKIIKEQQIDLLLLLGDLTEEKDRHGAWLVNQLVDHIYNLSRLCQIIILRGNHDYTIASTPFYAFLRRLDRVTWVNVASDGDSLSNTNIAGLGRVLFLPHTTNYKRDWEGLDFEDYDIIFAHNTFTGANAGHGKFLEGIPTEVFPSDSIVISGDIHVPQDLGPVTYVGAPYLIDFGDNYRPRLLLLDEMSIKSIKCPGPQKRLVEVTSEDGLKDLWDHRYDVTVNPGDIVKVRVHLTMQEYASWPEMKDQIHKWAEEHELELHQTQPVVSRTDIKTTKKKYQPKSDVELLETYAKTRNIDKFTLKAGLKLLRSK